MKRAYGHFDYPLLFIVVFLLLAGFIALSSASSVLGVRNFQDSYYYLRHQIVNGFLPGVLGFMCGIFIYYKRYKKIAPLFLLLSLLLLILVSFTPLGTSAGSTAVRWLQVGPLTFQPSEFVKLFFIIYIAAWLLKKPGLLPFLAVNAVIAGLLLAQPSTSTAVMLMVTVGIMYFVNGASWRSLIFLVLIGLFSFTLFIFLKKDYQWERITAFWNPREEYSQTVGFQNRQALIAIGSGGLTGVGYGQSRIKSGPLPETIGDSIFAVFAEEFGFIGASVLGGLFLAFVIRALLLARRVSDNFGRLLVTGFGAMIGIQAFVNMAAISNLIPLTGVPLPFVSYGGTALAVYLTMVGILLHVSKYGR